MLVLTIRTDKPEAQVGLYRNGQPVAHETWQAHRQLAETIHNKIEELLQQAGADWQALGGIIVFQGPGSFTGLRIGISAANALAYGLQVPVVGVTGKNWAKDGLARLQNGDNDTTVLPEYGAPVHITKQRK